MSMKPCTSVYCAQVICDITSFSFIVSFVTPIVLIESYEFGSHTNIQIKNNDKITIREHVFLSVSGKNLR